MCVHSQLLWTSKKIKNDRLEKIHIISFITHKNSDDILNNNKLRLNIKIIKCVYLIKSSL